MSFSLKRSRKHLSTMPGIVDALRESQTDVVISDRQAVNPGSEQAAGNLKNKIAHRFN